MKLSICIPTLNREDFIEETLQSILINNSKEIEVVIVDGNKNTETQNIASKYLTAGININYMKSDLCAGMDLDVIQAVTNSSGEYCWLMSDDDTLINNAIDTVLKKLESNNDIYLMNIFYCDRELKKFGKSNFLSNKRIENVFNIACMNSFSDYIKNSTSNNALLCFMPAVVFKRKHWINYDNQPEDFVYGYNHVFKLFDPINFLSEYFIEYIEEPLLMNRSFNDSYSSSGILKRYLIDFEGYIKLSEQLFRKNQFIKNIFIGNMKKEHGPLRIIKLRTMINADDWEHVKSLLLIIGYNKKLINLINLINFLKIGAFLIPLLDKLNMFFKRAKTSS